MNWVRSKIRFGARLALFALLLQAGLSFGHMHRDDLGLPPLGAADASQFETTSHNEASAAVADIASQQPARPAHRDQQPADDYCPICASMVLMATAVPALPPALVVPATIRSVWPPPLPVHGASPRIALSFHARAPPQA